MMSLLPREIFKAYDIRGIVGSTLTPPIVELIGRSIGSEAIARNRRKVVIGRDGRLSGPDFAKALATGLRAAGVDVIVSRILPLVEELIARARAARRS